MFSADFRHRSIHSAPFWRCWPAHELGLDDLGRRHVNALLYGHLGLDGDMPSTKLALAAELGRLLYENEARLVERSLHRAREAAPAAAHDEQVGVVGFVHVVVRLRTRRGLRLRIGFCILVLRCGRRTTCKTA